VDPRSLGTDDFERHRRRLFGIAYRMLGAVSDAEDVVQEAYLRWHRARAAGPPIDSAQAFLTTVTTRLAIDHLKSARLRREEYVGEWLPEPIVGPGRDDLEVEAEISLAFLVLLESLTPAERAAFVLREAFDYSYERIAGILETTEAACRQLVSRARRHVDGRRPRFAVTRESRDEVARRFHEACRAGDAAAIERLLVEDAAFVGDGGGKVPAAPRPVIGRAAVTRLVAGLLRIARDLSLTLSPAEVNGEPGFIVRDREGRLHSVLSLEIGGGGAIVALRAVANPAKLRHLGQLAGSE
jgi:RNA polymerase sigma-70 factor (ECF subfamily)